MRLSTRLTATAFASHLGFNRRGMRMDDRQRLIADLTGRPTVARRKAAKAAVKHGAELCPALLEGLEIEKGTSNNWETNVALVDAIGTLGCPCAEPLLKELVYRDGLGEHDIVKSAAAKALVRVARKDLGDVGPVLELLEQGGFSVKAGALDAVGYDQMRFGDEVCEALIRSMWDFGKDRDKRGHNGGLPAASVRSETGQDPKPI